MRGRPRSPFWRFVAGAHRGDVVARFSTIGGSLAWTTVLSPVRFHVLFSGRPDREGRCVTQTVMLFPRALNADCLRAVGLMAMLLHDDRRILDSLDFRPDFHAGDEPLRAFAARGRLARRLVTIVRLTLIHPCIGRRRGQRYIRSWQMEPLPPATIAGLTPPDVDVRFYDDRMEEIPFDEPTDLVAISVETYTARRAYQIASEYRRRGVPVVMGGFHPTLCPDEVAEYADSVVVGEAEGIWPRLIDDFRHGRMEPMYRAERPAVTRGGLRPDRRIFRGKRYLPIGLVEAGRGCHFKCDFCAVQAMFNSTQTRRPLDRVIAEIASIRDSRKLFFFVDDNITSNLAAGQGVSAGARAAQHPLGQPVQHQRRARRGVPVAARRAAAVRAC